MKILQVNATYGLGSTGTIVRDIHNFCLAKGHESFVAYAISDSNVVNGYKIGNWISNKLHAVLSRISGKQGYFSFLPTYRFIGYIKNLQPDVIHLHNLHSNYINLPILLKYLAEANIRTVVTLHDCWWYTGGCFHYTLARCDKWMKNCGKCPKRKQDTPAYLFDASSKILYDRKKYLLSIPRLTLVGVSDWISDEARKSYLGTSAIITIHNGIDLDVFKPTPSLIRNELGLDDKFIILGPASKWLQPYNKPILDYFSKNMESNEVLLLYGVENIGMELPENIRQFGYTRSREELASLYSCADVFVNPTREDSLSLINLEAQACGVPVITFDATGPKETVDGKLSFAVSSKNYKTILDLARIDIKSKYNSTFLLKFVSSNFDYKSSCKKHLELYLSL